MGSVAPGGRVHRRASCRCKLKAGPKPTPQLLSSSSIAQPDRWVGLAPFLQNHISFGPLSWFAGEGRDGQAARDADPSKLDGGRGWRMRKRVAASPCETGPEWQRQRRHDDNSAIGVPAPWGRIDKSGNVCPRVPHSWSRGPGLMCVPSPPTLGALQAAAHAHAHALALARASPGLVQQQPEKRLAGAYTTCWDRRELGPCGEARHLAGLAAGAQGERRRCVGEAVLLLQCHDGAQEVDNGQGGARGVGVGVGDGAKGEAQLSLDSASFAVPGATTAKGDGTCMGGRWAMAIGLFDDGFAFGSPTGLERTVRANDGAEIESRKSEYLVSSPRGGGRRSSTSSTRWRRKRTRTGEVGIGQGSRNDEPRKHGSSPMSYHKTTRMPASRPRVAFTMIKRLGTIHIDCPGRGRKRSSTFAIFCFRCHRAIPECAAHVGVVVAVSAEISPSTPKPPVPVPRIGLATCVFGIACSSAPGLLDVATNGSMPDVPSRLPPRPPPDCMIRHHGGAAPDSDIPPPCLSFVPWRSGVASRSLGSPGRQGDDLLTHLLYPDPTPISQAHGPWVLNEERLVLLCTPCSVLTDTTARRHTATASGVTDRLPRTA
ncbi:hypothetical protein Purlil1_3933 [Purpureocillium lilacinum]|uniref:Uncharacterized protein n=1 Tax=Purpureocillium lilacinum TaxID=33203 RepID=A0ABR0C6Z0_PURLI|nr:hypothetical protein Purlil1_3933 [Purpureocillium lilacinum]